MKTAQEDKKQAILDSARKLLVLRGFQEDEVTLDHVARAAKVAKGTLFLYYRNKEELFRAAFADLVDRLGGELEELLASPVAGRARLEGIVRVVLGHCERNRDFLSQVDRFPGCRLKDNHARMVRLLRSCSQDGLFPDQALGLKASFLFGLCRSAIIYKAIMGRKESLDSRAGRVAEMFLHGAAGAR